MRSGKASAKLLRSAGELHVDRNTPHIKMVRTLLG
jgi:hypothetical protein